MEKSKPVRKPHTSIADLLTWFEHPPENSPPPGSATQSNTSNAIAEDRGLTRHSPMPPFSSLPSFLSSSKLSDDLHLNEIDCVRLLVYVNQEAVVLDQGLETNLLADIQKYLEDLIGAGVRQWLISLIKQCSSVLLGEKDRLDFLEDEKS